MNEMDKLIARGIFSTLIVLILTIGSCTTISNNRAATLIGEGKDPTKVACALGTGNVTSQACAAIMNKDSK